MQKFTKHVRFELPASAVVVIRTADEERAFVEKLRAEDPTHPFLEQYRELDDR